MIIFTEWLKTKGLFEEFKENTKNSSYGMYYTLHLLNPVDYISKAFDWYDTPEDSGYWEDLNYHWFELTEAISDEIIFGFWEPKIRLLNPKDFR